MPLDTIRIMLVEDHPLFREGLRRVLTLEPDFEVVAEAEDGEQAVALAAAVQPDVILMDINLPKVNGLQAMRQILAAHKKTKVIVLTAYHSSAQMYQSLLAGAAAYFSKQVGPTTLVAAIRSVRAGHYLLGNTVTGKSEVIAWLFKQFQAALEANGSHEEAIFAPLSPREMVILQFVARGASNKEIAKELQISQQTVKNHITSILRKLSANDRTQAAMLAIRSGWIRLEDARPPA